MGLGRRCLVPLATALVAVAILSGSTCDRYGAERPVRPLLPPDAPIPPGPPAGGLLQPQFRAPNDLRVCDLAGDQVAPQVVSDGAGGAIVAWMDYRSGALKAYVQRISGAGALLWASAGVPVCTFIGEQIFPRLASDGAGGAIVVWQDYRNATDYNLYAQRVDASGAQQWPSTGVPICLSAGLQDAVRLVPDDLGGGIITWTDRRSAAGADVFAQRIDAAGGVEWAVDGLPVSAAPGDQFDPELIRDGSGGAILVWADLRAGGSDYDVYAQRVDASGAALWAVDGVPLCTAAYGQIEAQLVPDGSGGAIVAWFDVRNYTHSDIYAQRVNGSGTPLWTANGVLLCGAANSQTRPAVAPDGSGGAVVAWNDYRSGSNYDYYAQRVSASGSTLWAPNGVAISTAQCGESARIVVPDGLGGSLLAWSDYRNGFSNPNPVGQRLDAAGDARWPVGGTVLAPPSSVVSSLQLLVTGPGTALVIWDDARAGGYRSIYAQGIEY